MTITAETAVPYAILTLYDADMEINEENLKKVLESANIEVDPIWLSVFCRSIDRETVKSMLRSFEAGAAAPASAAPVAGAPSAPSAGKANAAPVAPSKEEPEEEEEMSLSLFD